MLWKSSELFILSSKEKQKRKQKESENGLMPYFKVRLKIEEQNKETREKWTHALFPFIKIK